MTAGAERYDVVVAGGGIAGLVASFLLSRETDGSVALLESSGALGGNVRVEGVQGFRVDRGVHALLLGSASALVEVLRTAGVRVEVPEVPLWLDDRGALKSIYPGSFRPGLREGLGALAGVAGGASRLQEAAAYGLYAMERPGEIDPEDVALLFMDAFQKGRLVGYPRGGWGLLLDPLAKESRARVLLHRGVQRIIVRDGRVEGVVSEGRTARTRCVVAAMPPRAVARALEDGPLKERLSVIRPTHGVSVEVGLKRKTPGPRGVVFTLDPPGLCWALGPEAEIGPPGHALLYGFSPLDRPTRKGVEARAGALLRKFDSLYPGWRRAQVFRRVRGLAVNNARLSRDYPRRRRVAVESGVRGLFFAGDWVRGRGIGGELAAWTGREAARRAAAELRGA